MLRWTTGDRRRPPPHPARPVPAAAAVPRRQRPGRDARPSSPGPGSRSPTSPASARSATACRRRWWSRSRRLLAGGEPFVYAYYDGIDKVAHEYGLGEHYDAELAAVDRLVADVLAVLPAGAVLLVTADHGQVDCGDASSRPTPPCWSSSPSSPARAASGGSTPARARPPTCSPPPTGRLRRRGLGGTRRAGPRRGLVRAPAQRRRRRPAGRRGPGGARGGRPSTIRPTPARSASCAATAR